MADQQINQGVPVPNNNAPDSSVFRYETVDELWDIGNSGEILSQDYINMFSAQADRINQFAIPANANLNTPYPGLATNTYDPYAQQSAPNLDTAEGKLRYLSEPLNVDVDKPIIKDPLYLGIRQSNFERYYKHPSFGELGWTPFADMESYYNANSTWWDDANRMFGQFGNLVGTGFISSYRSIADMFQGDPLGPDLKSAREFSDAMAIGNSTRGGVGGFINNTLLQSGYTFGIIGSVAVEELALWGASALTAGAASPIAAAKTGTNLARIGRSIANTFNVGRAYNATRNMLRTFNQADQARDLYNIAKGFGKGVGNMVLPETMAALKTLNTTKNAAQNITNLGKVSKTFGGFYRDLRSMNYALAEGKMEAGMVYDQQLADGYGIMLAQNKGEPLTEEQIRKVEDHAARAAFATTIANAPVIYLTNQLTLGNAFGAYNRSLARMLGDNVSGLGRRIIKTNGLRDATGKIVTRPFQDVGDGIKGYLNRMKTAGVRGSVKSGLQASLRYFSANLAEGLQEVYQEAVAEGTKEYYSALLEDPMAGGFDLIKGSVASATNAQFSAQGFETFMSGFLMGGIVQGPQKLLFQGLPNLYQQKFQPEEYRKYKENKEKFINSLVETLNDAYEVTALNPMASLFDTNKFNLITQKAMSGDKMQAAFDQSNFDFVDAGDFAKFQAIYSVISNDRAFEFREQFQDILKLTDEELAEAFPSFKADIRSGKIRERAQSMINKIDSMEEFYYENKDKFQNPFDPSIYTPGTREWNDEELKRLSFEHARYLYLFTQDGFNRALERANSIYEELSADPLVSDMAASDITVLLSNESLIKEIAILAQELETIDEKTNKELVKQKRAKLEGLTAISNVLYDKENQKSDGSFDRRKINKLVPVFENYLKKLANSKNGFVEKDKITEALKKIVDYSALKGRAKAYDKTIEYLNNPARFDEITQRTYDYFKNVYNNRVEIYRNAVKKYVEKNEINTFLNALAELDVYPDFEQVKHFMLTGDIDVLQDFFTEAGILNKLSDSELYNKIENLKSIYKATTTEEVKEEAAEPKETDEAQKQLEEDLQIEGPNVVLEGTTENQHPFIKNLLDRKYREYVVSEQQKGKTPLSITNWMKTEDALRIKSAYIALKKLWHSDLSNKGVQNIDQKFENDLGFKEWLNTAEDQYKINKVFNTLNVNANDFKSDKPTVKEDQPIRELKKEEKLIDDTYNAVRIIEETALGVDETTGEQKPIKFYKLVDKNNAAISDQIIASVGLDPGVSFMNINEARKAAKAIDALLIDSTPFSFGGVVLGYGSSVYDTNGVRYTVVSDPSSIEKGKKLALYPVSENKPDQTPADRYRDAIKVDELTFKQSYSLEKFNYEKVDSNTSKLTIEDPVKIHAHKNEGESPADAETRLRFIAENLTPQERAGLSIIVKRNENAGAFNGNYKVSDKKQNAFINKIKEPYTVGLVISNPETAKKINSLLSKEGIQPSQSADGVIAYIPTGAFQILDINKKPVSLTSIPEGAFENAFITYKNQINPLKTFEKNALVQKAFVLELTKKLGDNNSGAFSISDFPGFYINITSSLDSFGKQETPLAMSQLKYNTVDGVRVLYVNTRLDDGRISTSIITDISDPTEEDKFIDKLQAEIPNHINEQAKSAQRYVGIVKLPNGIYTVIPLKSDKISDQDLQKINKKLAERAIETINKNLKGKGEIQEKKIDNKQYNTLFNADVNGEFYITTNLNGYDVEVNVNSDGSFRIELFDKTQGQVIAKVNTFRQETLSYEGQDNPDILNNLINRLNNELEKQKDAFREKAKKNPSIGRPNWLNLSVENVRYNFSRDISLEEVFQEARSNIGENVRSNYRLLLGASSAVQQTAQIPSTAVFTPTESYTDAEGNPIKKGEELKTSVESLETSETSFNSILDMSDEVFEEYAKNDFQDLDIQIKKQVAAKIALKQELTEREQRLVNNNVSGPIINFLATQVQSENKVSDKTTLQQAILNKREELKARKNEVMDATEGNAKAKLLAVKKDPITKQLQKELDDLEKQGIANKIIAPGFTEQEIDDIDEFIAWANNNLPEFIDIDDLSNLRDNLLANGVRVGAFGLSLVDLGGGLKVKGTIYTGASNPFKYHEAFHAVFRALLSNSQQKKLLTIAESELRSKLGSNFESELQKFKNSADKYKLLSKKALLDEFVEEYMADEFQKFKKSPKSTRTNSAIKNFFNKLIEWLKGLFGSYTPNQLQNLFKEIDSGKYKSAPLANNRFTDSMSKGVTLIANKIIRVDRIESDNGSVGYKSLDSRIAKQLVSSMTARVINMQIDNPKLSLDDIIDDTLVSYEILYNSMNEQYDDLNNDLILTLVDIEKAFENYSNDFKEAIKENLKFYDLKVEDQEEDQADLEDEFGPRGLRDTSQFDKDVTSIGGFSSLSQFLRKYIGTTIIAESDQFGNEYLVKPEYDANNNVINEGEKLLVTVDYSSVYEGMLKAVKNLKDPVEILQRAYYFGLSNPETKAFVDRLFDDLGIEWEGQLEDGILPEYAEKIKEPSSEMERELIDKLQLKEKTGGVKRPLLFQAVLKGFENFRVDYLFTQVTPEGKLFTYTASNRDDIRAQIDRWGQAYMTKTSALLLSNKAIVDLMNKLERRLKTDKPISSITNKELIRFSNQVRDSFYRYLGISLSPMYIQYSILNNVTNLTKYQKNLLSSYKNEKALTFEDINEIKKAIEGNKDIFSDSEGTKNRLRRIAIGNAAFDESVGTSVFKNPNGDFVYAHQLPTFHLKKIAELNDAANNGAILDVIKQREGLENNLLLNSPAFKALSSEGLISIIRSAGSKKGEIEVTDDDLLSESTGKTPSEGKTYGDFTPKEFIINLVNSYTGMVNPKDGAVDTVEWINENGDIDRAALAVNLIRVIEASNTGDNLALPVIKAVTKNNRGETIITDETLNAFINNIEVEFNRIKKEANPETATQELIEGYNAISVKDASKGTNEILGVEIGNENESKVRAYRFANNDTILSPKGYKPGLEQATLSLFTSDAKLDRVQKGTQTSLIYNTSAAKDVIGLTMPGLVRKTTITSKEGEVIEKKITTRGSVLVTNQNVQEILKALSGSISKTKTDKFNKKVKINNTNYYVETVAEAKFLRGQTRMYVYDIHDANLSDAEILNQVSQDVIFNAEGYLTQLTEAAKDLDNTNLSFQEVLDKIGVSIDELKSFIRYRLNEDFAEFKQTVAELNADKEFGNFIEQGVTDNKGFQTVKTVRSNELLNLEVDNFDYNLMQIYFNDYVNTKAINQILLGDEAITLKDAVDKIKRAKAQNAAYYSAASYINAPEYGINKALQEFSLFALTEPFVQKTHNPGTTDNADAQLWMTTKSARYFLFGFGKLTASQAEMLDKIERGEELTLEELEMHVKNKEMLNSMKLVYADGETFVKMSAFTLIPEYTSLKDKNGEYTIPKPNRVPLHNLRMKLEAFERENDTVTVAAPQSALKMLKKNISNIHKVTGTTTPLTKNQSVTLDANYLGLQVINPSNKTTITDPTQVKTIITSEQNDNTTVILNGKKTTIGKIRDAYNLATKARGDLSYISKRNLVFDLDYAMDELHKSMDQGRITPDLYSYLKYAEASLASTNSSSHLMELFSLNENGEQKYNLNNPLTYDKYMSLFMSYFSKSVFSEKLPGITAALLSDYGVRIYRRVLSVDENGMPDKQEVIPERMYHAMKAKPEIQFNIDEGSYPGNDQNLAGLAEAVKNTKEGVVIIDRLRHNLKEYDKKGKFTGQRYGEMLLPAHHSEVIDKAERQNKGVPEAISKMFAVRIPSQDNHSTYNAKWVDFMPPIYGSTAVFAREIIEISGADFDIDKVYMQIKEFYTKNNEFFEYGNKATEEENYFDYVRYLNNNVNKSGIYNEALLKYKSRGAKKEISFTTEEEKQLRRAGMSQNSINAASVLFLPRTFTEYKAYKKKFGHEPYAGALNNQILDYKYALMGNDHVTEKKPLYLKEVGDKKKTTKPTQQAPQAEAVTEGLQNVIEKDGKLYVATTVKTDVPYLDENGNQITAPAISYEAADIEVLLDLWEELKVLLPEWASLSEEEGIDVDNMLGKLKMYANNKEGARSIGAVVLPNLYLNLLQEYKVKIDDPESVISFNGQVYDDFSVTHEIKNLGAEGQRTQYIISALITAATDNAKERLLAKLGLNINALSVVANLTALGVPIKTSILFVNNPTIRNAYYRQANSTASDPVYASEIIENRIDDLESLIDKITVKNITDQDLIDQIDIAPIPVNATFEELKALSDEKEIDYDDINIELNILNLFQKADKISKTTKLMGDLLTLTKGLGKDLDSIQKRKNAITKLGIELSDESFNKMSNKPVVDVRKIFTGNTWEAGYLNRFNEFTNSLMPKIMLSMNPLFSNTINNLTRQTKIVFLGGERRGKAIRKLSKDFLSYLTIKGYMYNRQQNNPQSIATLTNDLIYPGGSESIIDIVNRLREITKDEENYFLNSFIILENADQNGNKTGINLAASNTFLKYNDSQKLSIQNGFIKLFYDAATRRDAISLMHYMMVKDGLQYNYKTIVEAVAPIAIDGYLNYINTIQEAFNRSDDTLFESTFGLKLDDLIVDFSENYLMSAENAYLIPEVSPTVGVESKSPVYTETVNQIKVLKVDLYNGITPVVQTDQKVATREIKSLNELAKNIIAKNNRSVIRNNFYRSLPSETEDIYVSRIRNNKTYLELNLPFVVRVKSKSEDGNVYFTYYSLNRIQSINPGETVIDPITKTPVGSYAEYVEMPLKGSSAQNAVGFLFGDRPDANAVRDYVQVVNSDEITEGENIPATTNELSQESGPVISEGASVEATEKGISVNGENISLIESLKQGIPVGEATTDFRGGIPTEEEPTDLLSALRRGIPIGEEAVEESVEETKEESGLMADLRKGIPIQDSPVDNYEDGDVTKTPTVNDDNLIPEDEMLIELLNWWDRNIEDPRNVDSVTNKENLKQKLNITSYDMFKYEFYFSEFTSTSEYLEHIENCYL